MSGRSSLPHNAPGRSAGLVLVAAALGCSGGTQAPEADPAALETLAATMIDRLPPPGFVECKGDQVLGGATMTAVTALKLAQQKAPAKPEFFEWVNPHELDSPAARTLIDAKASTTAKRQAAAELLAAPFYLVYLVDLVNAPMALEVKELKRGTGGGRAIRFDRQGNAVCSRVFIWQNDKAKSDWAIKQSDRPRIDPAVAKVLQDDLRHEMLKRITILAQPPPTGAMPERTPDGFGN